MEKDKIIENIRDKKINPKHISSNYIRNRTLNIYTPNDKVYEELGSGRNILKTQDQLNQYWCSYTPMIEKQWKEIFNQQKNNLNFLNSNNIEIIDYACGQGLASILFFDRYSQIKKSCSKITLIEPSEIALNRAKSILQCYLPEAEIKSINKKLDDVLEEDIKTDNAAVKVHLFSNILDIEGFNITNLFNKILKNKGSHHFLAVSHDWGPERLKEVYNEFTNKKSSSFKVVNCTPPKNFNVKRSDGKDNPTIYFYISFKV